MDVYCTLALQHWHCNSANGIKGVTIHILTATLKESNCSLIQFNKKTFSHRQMSFLKRAKKKKYINRVYKDKKLERKVNDTFSQMLYFPHLAYRYVCNGLLCLIVLKLRLNRAAYGLSCIGNIE